MWEILLAFMNKTWDSGVDDVVYSFCLFTAFEGRAVYDVCNSLYKYLKKILLFIPLFSSGVSPLKRLVPDVLTLST
jgi:hypothetical protein